MISMKINDKNNFMQHLLMQETFDFFLFCEGQVRAASTFHLDGRINRDYYNSEELSDLSENFISWKNIRPVVFSMIQGKRVPTKMKLVFALPSPYYEKILRQGGLSLSPSDIGGLYLHVLYENDTITLVTGTSLNLFSMDKTLDRYWDNFISSWIGQHFDADKI